MNVIGGFNAVSGGLLVAGVIVAFWAPLRAMVEQWSATPMYSHAFAVPFISLWLIWSWRPRFASTAIRPARVAGALVLTTALAALVAGEVAAVQIAQQMAFVLAVAGVVLFVFGYRHLAIAGPAIGYLLFMVPVWDVFTDPLHEPFQQNSAQLGVWMMQAAGVPAYRDGTIIALPNIVLEVARACSGVNYLVAVLALALPLAFLRLETWWKRAVLVGSAMVISALANAVRVALIGVLAYLEVGSPLHGPFHVLHGLFVAGVGYLVLFAGLYLLEDGEGRTDEHAAAPALPQRWSNGDAYALSLVFWTIAFVGVAPSSIPVTLAEPLDHLPMTLGSWTAELDAGIEAPTAAWTSADEHLRRQYRNRSGQASAVDIWYFSAQRQSREVANFMVSSLHAKARTRPLALRNGTAMTVNAIEWPERREIAIFWYEFGGLPESSEYGARLRSAWSALRSRRNHAAAIMLTAPQTEAGGNDAVLAGLEDLAREVHTGLARHWPTLAAHPTRPPAAAPAESAGADPHSRTGDVAHAIPPGRPRGTEAPVVP